MKFTFFLFLSTILSFFSKAETKIDSVKYGNFGEVKLYYSPQKSNALVLFISGDGGWNAGVVSMAKSLVSHDAMVVGIDIRHYFTALAKLNTACYYPASDFEDLSLMLQKKYHFENYFKPILVGYSSGATLVYGMLVQAPANTFKGGIALGFCPDLKTGKQLCKGEGLTSHSLPQPGNFYLEKSNDLTAPFIVLNGIVDQVCPFAATKDFLTGMPYAELITLNKVGHGFSVENNWMPEFLNAYNKIQQAPSYAESVEAKNKLLQKEQQPLPGNLPLTVIQSANANNNEPLIFLISGDGGWTSFDQSLAHEFTQKNFTVIGLDAQKYFWNEKTPDQTTADISKAVSYYMQQYHKQSFILAGYSFGGSVVPFVASRFSAALKSKLVEVLSLSPDLTADFEIHVTDMLGFKKHERYDVLQEAKKIMAYNPVCFFGQDEEMETATAFKKEGIKVILLPGSHHYNNNLTLVANLIESEISKK